MKKRQVKNLSNQQIGGRHAAERKRGAACRKQAGAERFLRRALSLLVAAAMIAVLIVPAMAAKEPVAILAFEEVEGIAAPTGTAMENIGLPAYIPATISLEGVEVKAYSSGQVVGADGVVYADGEEKGFVNTVSIDGEAYEAASVEYDANGDAITATIAVPVTWEDGGLYDADTEGEYLFTAVIDSAFSYASARPTIKVIVDENAAAGDGTNTAGDGATGDTVGANGSDISANAADANNASIASALKKAGLLRGPLGAPAASTPIPVLDPSDPNFNKIAVITSRSFMETINYYPTLQAAMQAIGNGAYNYTVVFCEDYGSTASDWSAVSNYGGRAQQITFTSTYNNGTADVMSTLSYAVDTNNQHIYMNADTVFDNIIFHATGSTRSLYIYGRYHKLTFGENFDNSASPRTMQVFAGDQGAGLTGNTDLTILGGNFWQVFAGSWNGSCSPNLSLHVTVGGAAYVNVLTSNATNSTMGSGTSITYDLDGTDGALVKAIYIGGWFENDNPGSATANVNIKNMKGIGRVNAYSASRNNVGTNQVGIGNLANLSSSHIYIEGDCQIEHALWAYSTVDVELAPGATLQMGSTADGSTDGSTAGYTGAFTADKTFTMNAGSKLIMAGTSIDHSDTNHRIKTLNVAGSGAEIDIYKRGTSCYPLNITGSKTGNVLSLGFYKEPNTSTEDEIELDTLLTFSNQGAAVLSAYTPGANVTQLDTSQKKNKVFIPQHYIETVGPESGIRFGLFNYDGNINSPANGFVTTVPDNQGATKFYFAGGHNSDYPNPGIPYPRVSGGTTGNQLGGNQFSSTLVNGHPAFTGPDINGNSGRSLGYLFGAGGGVGVTEYPVVNTPLQYNPSNGYYWYSSDMNALDYDEDESRFKVRNYVERSHPPAGIQENDMLPFDHAEQTSGSSTFYYRDYVGSDNTYFPDFWYGMTMEFDFMMTDDGTWMGNDMIFEFLGDDDVAVYIDDVLVLDLSGIHWPWGGTINFATGQINKGSSYIDSSSTSIRAMYDQAGRTPAGGWNAAGTTFAPYTEHELKFYYLERGSNNSVCDIAFSLPVVEPPANETAEIRVQKKTGNIGLFAQDPMYADLTGQKHIISLSDTNGAVVASMALKHNDVSKKIFMDAGSTPAVINVSEIVPYGYVDTYAVSAEIVHADGSIVTHRGNQIPVTAGDEVIITVTNTYTPEPYFKARTDVKNLFQ